MLKNYFKIALRNILRQKGHSFINISGLAVGLACTVLIVMWIQDELSYDHFHKNGNRIFRVVENQFYGGGDAFQTPQTPAPLSAVLKSEFPEIEKTTRVLFTPNKLLFDYKDQRFYESNGLYVDPEFLSMFSFPLTAGQSDVALKDPNSIILTKEFAQKYFGSEDPMGKSIRVDKYNLVVTGIFEKIPRQSHLQFDFVLPAERLRMDVPDQFTPWGNNWLRTYVMLNPNTDYRQFTEKIADVIKKHNDQSKTELFLQPMTDIYLRTDFNHTPTRMNYVYTLGVIAALILLIACINFTNLSTARSLKRSREVGLRKVVGADRFQLIKQFLGEAFFLSLISMGIALVLIEIILPFFNDLTAKSIALNFFDSGIGLMLISIVIITGILSGIYPALVLSGYRPVQVLKGSFQKSTQGVLLRRILVTVQFTLSIALIISAAFIYQQLEFMQHKSLGYEKEQLIRIPLRGETRNTYSTFKERLLQNRRILSVSASNHSISSFGTNTWDVKWPGQREDEKVLTTVTAIDYDYLKTMRMELVHGREFSKEFPTDSVNVIINEKAMQAMNLMDPLSASLKFWDETHPIVGVVKDFHYQSVRSEIIPLVFIYNSGSVRNVFAKIQSHDMAATVKSIENDWTSVNLGSPFEFNFVDEEIDQLYRSEQQLSKIYNSFAILAVFISCLGLFGLASFATEQRTKEIGIRKVLGASIARIVSTLTTEFLKLVLLANIIGWPIAYLLMSRWLQDFAYRIDINIGTFILTGLVTLIIAIATVSYRAIRAATANPVEALKYE
ncbi:FtsX-like permease family protein [bacterium]|nr:MAG: FtsX-like permease family protein [bacterium]